MAHALTASHTKTVKGVHLPDRAPKSLWDVAISKGIVDSISPHTCHTSTACGHSLLLPSLIHPHVHLDKAFLLSSNIDKYQELAPQDGSFPEALQNTAAAKARYTPEDLYQRGSWLIDESIAAGVTAMRAFVEVDETVGMLCIDTALVLKRDFASRCHIQIVAFAQDPIFSGPNGATNRALLQKAVEIPEIEVLGTTPYVESSFENGNENVDWAIGAALRAKKHLDFHLDYNLDMTAYPMINDVIAELIKIKWKTKTPKTVVIGHCTRLTSFPDDEMKSLSETINNEQLPISFVGLPSSDLYMMGRPSSSSNETGARPRGTLQIPSLIQRWNLNAAIGINNVSNAFTPYGSLDPLWLACLGVGLYHAGTSADATLLYECVSVRARRAIGLEALPFLSAKEGEVADYLIVECKTGVRYSKPPGRQQVTVAEIVWDPPSVERRSTIYCPTRNSRGEMAE